MNTEIIIHMIHGYSLKLPWEYYYLCGPTDLSETRSFLLRDCYEITYPF